MDTVSEFRAMELYVMANQDRDRNDSLFLLGKLVSLAFLFWFFRMLGRSLTQWQERREAVAKETKVRKDRLDELERQKQVDAARKRAEEIQRRKEEQDQIERERSAFIGRPIPPDIQRSMRDFLSGIFIGADQSPLSYVGYRVGKTKGLSERDRHRCLEVCFRMEIPDTLDKKYVRWGQPATALRFRSISDHISYLADRNSSRRQFDVAVAEWRADAAWFQSEFAELARRFSSIGSR